MRCTRFASKRLADVLDGAVRAHVVEVQADKVLVVFQGTREVDQRRSGECVRAEVRFSQYLESKKAN